MNKKTITKILATILAFTLTFTNVILLGIYTQETLAASANLEEQNKAVNKTSIEFDAYFQKEGVITHSKEIDVKENQDTLYLSLKVSDGYLTNANIKIENTNFSLIESEEDLELVQSINPETNTITLNQISKGESVILEIPIKMNTDSSFEVQNVNRISDVILEGTYVDNDGDSIQISKTIQVNASITAEAKANLTNEISKYVQFDINGEKGVIFQEIITSNVENNVLPVKQTKIEIEIPKINGVEPKAVVFSANSTKATNGEDITIFAEGDYIFEDGKIILTIDNGETENGTISWEKQAQDEIILTCVYGESAIVSLANIQNSINSEITLYNNEEKVIQASVNEILTLEEQIGDIMTYGISTDVSSLYKGYMETAGAANTIYVDTWSANIGSRDLVDNIILENKTSYLDKNSNEYTSNQVYTYTKISEENFLNILGEEGYINIYNKEGEIIATLDKDNLEYEYTGGEEEVSYIKIETSTPISEGVLSVENGRGIKALEYSEAQEELFTGMKTTIEGKVILNNQEILAGSESKEIEFIEPSSQAELTLSNNNMSTVVTNEGVELRVTLKTTDASTILYKNPVVEITLPSYVTKISADNVRLLYEDELKLESAKLYTNEEGNKVIRIELSGEQTKFNEVAQTKGATLIIKADITVDELTPTKTENVTLYVSNELTGEKVSGNAEMNFVAPIGIVTVNQITGYNDEGETVTSISGKSEVGEIETNAEAKTATVNMTIINNYNYNLENVVILGRTPFEGNKTVTTSKELGSTFTAEVVSHIQAVSGISGDQITIYYSSNGEATKDLTDSANGWTTNQEDLTEIKSYMIVLNDYTLNTGDLIGFSYNVQIPGNLSHDESVYATFAVYYNKQEDTETNDVAQATVEEDGNITRISTEVKKYGASNFSKTEWAEATLTGVSTGEGPDLSVVLTADVEDKSEVEEKSIITYTAAITNNSSRVAENVYLTLDIPDRAYFITDAGSTYSDAIQISIGEIAAGETRTVSFQLRMKNYVESITYDDIEDEVEDKYEIDINNLESLEDYLNIEEGEEQYTEEEALEFYTQYLWDVAKISTELTVEDFRSEDDYNMYLAVVEEYLASLEDSTNSNMVKVKVIAKVDGYEDSFESNELVNTIISAGDKVLLDMSLNANISGDLTVGQRVDYLLTVKTSSTETITNVVVKCVIPEGYVYVSDNNDGIYDESTRTVTWTFAEFKNQKSVSMTLEVGDLSDGIYSRDLPVAFTATCDNSEETFISNTITRTAVSEGYTITQTSNISNGYISSGEEITYAVTVKNVGVTNSSVTITDYLPSGLTFVKYYYIKDGKTVTQTDNSSSAVSISVTVAENETITIYITAKANSIGKNETLEVTNKVKLSSGTIDELWANEITHTILGSDVKVDDEGNISGNNGKTTYIISGVAWLDENENGQRDSAEELLSGIRVYLLESTTNKVVSSTSTKTNGGYEFSEVSAGTYLVAFEYDTSLYNVTTYQTDGVDTSVDSDAITMTLTINGTSGIYGATDTLVIAGNKYNIDIGLVNSPKFDLELTKAVTLIQVSNSKGTENYTFNNTDLAKVEIPSKNMNGSVVAITYALTVKNTGAVAGYVNKIIDYLPSDLSFSSTLNPEWYEDTDGNLYCSTLAGRMINPGESVEVDLILTKTMTDENTGIVNNTAEIYEASNDMGITDIDSTPGNKATGEDDYGLADVIITVKTGGVVMYLGIALVVLLVFALGGYGIKKKVLTKI